MAAAYATDVPFNGADDDDGMPPLVDAPAPSMTFTFATDMTPITFSTDPLSFELPPGDIPADLSAYSPHTSPALGPIRVSHAKKRDASYIPRPPNAFILFRSSFIHAQHIPGKIEGNHSALSKIIGKYWKALPREEREVWEAKAVLAQAEHRKRYPDWRFRPAANALAKVKDGPKRRVNKKGRGEAEKEEHSREKRCAIIADLLVAGKTGSALEAAIKEYDCTAGAATKIKEESVGGADAPVSRQEEAKAQSPATVEVPIEHPSSAKPARKRADTADVRPMTPDPAFDARFKVPLTAMFKRSSSAPAPHTRSGTGSGYFDARKFALVAHGDLAAAGASWAANVPYTNYPIAPPGKHEDAPRADNLVGTASDGTGAARAGGVSVAQPLIPEFFAAGSFSPVLGQWNEMYAASPAQSGCWSPPLPAFVPDADNFSSPLQSPMSAPFNLRDAFPDADAGVFGAAQFSHEPHQSSYSSLKGWAGDAYFKRVNPEFAFAPPFALPPVADAAMMHDPLEGSVSAMHGDWYGNNGVFVASLNRPYLRWDFFDGSEGVPIFPQAHALNCLPDDRLFFN
ncbi:predicted protein [Postia placenta Mad-698-R]|uniref:HMG box domain-containing protein n=1 Tax=Postia placenta MAD-698-R-SB12 TaxID=670580 RepID=A0A1X6MXW0_9APHY|nr:hypothetical protein POSPLADRAFT_1034682 [Postia placenta MAD-698-R-SB12]EED78094.1 predicted protein [Postia placenta Mad-698-R]OSX61201.1 hypothetical protein POSPLADRAFT_1034682 [Postia placenta MAD-698-R-SB12]